MKRKQQGFTLIEIIIALFIFAIIAVIITYGLNSIFNSKAKVDAHEKRLDQLSFALVLMKHDISQLIDYHNRNTGSSSPATIGDNSFFSFTSTNNANPMGLQKRSNLLQVDYRVLKGKIYRAVWFRSNATQDQNIVYQQVLLSGISDFKIRYYTQSGFVDSWPPRQFYSNNPPLAVQITFKLKNWGQVSQLIRIRGVRVNLQA